MNLKNGVDNMDELSILAKEIVKTIEREDFFENTKCSGGFVEVIKAKDAKKVLL